MNIETANRLVEWRKKKGFSQEELADKLGISRQAVSKWERSEASPDTDNLIALAKLYGVTLDDLVNVEKPMEGEEQNEDPIKASATIEIDNDDEDDEDDDDDDEDDDDDDDKGGKENVHVHIGKGGLHIHCVDDEGEVHIDGDGKVNISGSDVVSGFKTVHVGEDKPGLKTAENVVNSVGFLLAAVAYILLGMFWKTDRMAVGWAAGWLLFLLPCTIGSFLHAIRKRNPSHVAMPLICVLAYVGMGLIGMAYGVFLWHPWWVIFFAVPVYYTICGFITKS